MADDAGVRLLDYCATGNVAVEGWLHEEALLLTLALHRQQRAAGIEGGVAEKMGTAPISLNDSLRGSAWLEIVVERRSSGIDAWSRSRPATRCSASPRVRPGELDVGDVGSPGVRAGLTKRSSSQLG